MHYTASKVEERMNNMNIPISDNLATLEMMSNMIVHNLSPLLNNKVNVVIVMDGKIPKMKRSHSMAKNGKGLSQSNVEGEQCGDYRPQRRIKGCGSENPKPQQEEEFKLLCSRQSLTKCTDIQCPLHRTLPRVISYGKRRLKNRDERTRLHSDQSSSPHHEMSKLKGYRNFKNLSLGSISASYGHSNNGLCQGSRNSSDHSSLFKDDFKHGVFQPLGVKPYQRVNSRNSTNWKFQSMNAMERKSYFVELMLMLGIPVMVKLLGKMNLTHREFFAFCVEQTTTCPPQIIQSAW